MWQNESLEHYRQFQQRSLQIRDHSLRSRKVRLGFRKPGRFVNRELVCLRDQSQSLFTYRLGTTKRVSNLTNHEFLP